MPETLDEKGKDINAIIGFMKGLKNAFYNTQPNFFAITFDSRENKRKDIDSEYKAQRKETPESLKRQIEELINLLQEW
jgi:DNA-directed DNA polymerase